jgi:hypothetical protein
MKIHTMSLIAASALVAVSAASAQTDSTRRTTSTRRIPISKDVPATTTSRVDTVTLYRTDTVTMTSYIHDTVTVYRTDTVTTSAGTVAMPMLLRQIGGFYIGVDGGAAIPSGDELRTAQTTGWHVDVPFGWDPVGSPLGIRFAAGYSRFGTRSPYSAFSFTPQIWQGDADLKLRLPMTSMLARRFSIYGVGGATYNRFKGLAQFNTTTGAFTVGNSTGAFTTTTGFPINSDDSWHDAWGWNAGGGLAFGVGRTNLFVESRYIHFNRSGDLNQVPIVVGLSWF